MARTRRVVRQQQLTRDFGARLGRARHRIVGKVLRSAGGSTVIPLARWVAEGATWAAGTAVLSRLGRRERRDLSEIAAAEARLDAGTFGLCEQCGAPISLRRLRATPTARRCTRCEERRASLVRGRARRPRSSTAA
jgi:RNA polymerase-binding transcription factor DksA